MGDDLIPPEDVRIERLFSRPPGGQHVLDRSAAVKVTHLPTGVTILMGGERSPHANRAAALRMLASYLTDPEARRDSFWEPQHDHP